MVIGYNRKQIKLIIQMSTNLVIIIIIISKKKFISDFIFVKHRELKFYLFLAYFKEKEPSTK